MVQELGLSVQKIHLGKHLKKWTLQSSPNHLDLLEWQLSNLHYQSYKIIFE